MGWFEENISQVSTWAFLGPRGGGEGEADSSGWIPGPRKGQLIPFFGRTSIKVFNSLPVCR